MGFHPLGISAGRPAAIAFVLLAVTLPETVPANRDRWFPAPFDRTWKVVNSVLAGEGFSINRTERGKGFLQTGWFRFPPGWFGPIVAFDGPTLSWEYGIYHRNVLDEGRCYLKISVRPSGKGTRISIAAIVQEWAFHRDLREWAWVHRDSNGAIEIYLLDRMEKALRGDPAPPRIPVGGGNAEKPDP